MLSFHRHHMLSVALCCIAQSASFLAVDGAAALPKGCRVCTSSPCSSNGSELLLDAMNHLSCSNKVDILETPCLGGCGSGIQVKPFDKTTATNNRRITFKAVPTEEAAIATATEILKGLAAEGSALNTDMLQELRTKLQSGERVFNSEPPEMCMNCNNALQLYRGKCAKCGKHPY